MHRQAKHLATMIRFALGTGARKSEQLTLKMRQGDFFRNLIIFERTKSNRPRFVEMNRTRLGEAGFNACDIAKLMGHANISTSQRYICNLPVGAGEAVMLKNQRRHSKPAPTLSAGIRAL
jgi:integrase